MKNITFSLFTFASYASENGAWALSFFEFWNDDTEEMWTLLGIGRRPDGTFRITFFDNEEE